MSILEIVLLITVVILAGFIGVVSVIINKSVYTRYYWTVVLREYNIEKERENKAAN